MNLGSKTKITIKQRKTPKGQINPFSRSHCPAPLLSVLARRQFRGEGGGSFEAFCGRSSPPPPSSIHPTSLEGCFQGGGAWKLAPPRKKTIKTMLTILAMSMCGSCWNWNMTFEWEDVVPKGLIMPLNRLSGSIPDAVSSWASMSRTDVC